MDVEKSKQVDCEEEYVLLDLDDVCMQADIAASVPYVISGLNTLNPTLTIGDRLKLIGEYEETVGTCYMFSECDGETVEKNKEHKGDSNQAPSKQIRHVATAHKVLKFRLEAGENSTDGQ
ncbi:hypothetical protein AXF42_Ash009835 [Apostasia shenzhenica]|uniref:Transcription factor TFIIIC triple barrel domain-containing protein n=1 Tax=Apostasia shenzhenica TaxID=1088818 RepID=A0A2I0AX84_9ASPA|nr:hypothetical protein AXF42_Ash009835 [Apostasia shenzhenica]